MYRSALVLAVFLVAGISSASAGLLAYDGFSSAVRGEEIGLDATDWTPETPNPEELGLVYNSFTIPFSDYCQNYGTPGSMLVYVDRDRRTFSRPLAAAPSAGDFFVSYLVSYGGMEFGDSRLWMTMGGAFGMGPDGVYRTSAHFACIDVDGGIFEGGRAVHGEAWPYHAWLVIAKFTDDGDDGVYEGGRIWVLAPEDYDAIKAGGITESEMDANCWASASDAGKAQPALVVGDVVEFDVMTREFALDEFKVATDLDTIFTPEPGSLGLLAIGAIGLLRRRHG